MTDFVTRLPTRQVVDQHSHFQGCIDDHGRAGAVLVAAESGGRLIHQIEKPVGVTQRCARIVVKPYKRESSSQLMATA
ncbi:MAG: hypothetical protein PVG41_09335 [Desulfobacteraceae bacterium]